MLILRTLQAERSFTLPARWNELQQSYNAARQAVTDQIATWRNGAAAVLEGLNAKLEAKVVGVGVPEAQVRDEAAALSTTYEPVRRLVERPSLTYGEAPDSKQNYSRRTRASRHAWRNCASSTGQCRPTPKFTAPGLIWVLSCPCRSIR